VTTPGRFVLNRSRRVNLAEIDRDADELRRIDGALARINGGNYGFCELRRRFRSACRQPTTCAACTVRAVRENARGQRHAEAIKKPSGRRL
jgi:RNA polymerase-binding transcription factor DksA